MLWFLITCIIAFIATTVLIIWDAFIREDRDLEDEEFYEVFDSCDEKGRLTR